MSETFANPILPGAHPDPSLCRAGSDFYLATSTFEYFPGITLHHSRDLIHWRPIGSALDRPSQLPLDGIRPSAGIYAPTLRRIGDRFYLICTLIEGSGPSGHFLVWADDPAGDWSEPVWIADAPGLDPSLLAEQAPDGTVGRVWFCATYEDDPETRPGRTVVYLAELDLATGTLGPDRFELWRGAAVGARWAEGPHLYRIGDWYYLVAAEGGTELNHAVVVARSRSITGPYEGCPANPVATARHLGPDEPFVAVGHADLVELADGSWWAVALAVRSAAGRMLGLGRETVLMPVTWHDGWPVFNPGYGKPLPRQAIPSVAPQLRSNVATAAAVEEIDDFESGALGPQWLSVRTPREQWWDLAARPGWLRLAARVIPLSAPANPSFLGRRVTHPDFRVSVLLDPSGLGEGAVAGLALRLREADLVRLEIGSGLVALIERRDGTETERFTRPVTDGPVELSLTARGRALQAEIEGEPLGELDHGWLLDAVATQFFGLLVGPYAVGRDGHADVDRFGWQEQID